MSEAALKSARTPKPLNGVDVPTPFATLDAVKARPELARFQFRATNCWQGTDRRTRIESFFRASSEPKHADAFPCDTDPSAVLVGHDDGPLPVESLLAGLVACLPAGSGNIAAARGITVEQSRRQEWR